MSRPVLIESRPIPPTITVTDNQAWLVPLVLAERERRAKEKVRQELVMHCERAPRPLHGRAA